jgi:hypothetical protein
LNSRFKKKNLDPYNEEKREAGGQDEFSVGLAARRDVASQPAT